MSTHPTSSTLLTTREAARRLGLAAGTLQNWRIRGEGPAFVRLGKAVRYDEHDLARFIAQGRTAQ
ncbi:MAG: helix-turn-helix domain-containing protein [Candidatus Latescibacteria bacterium]|nr:helix-turn-helix domain-containing protein [Candidatus Latescibacterota bacterium]